MILHFSGNFFLYFAKPSCELERQALKTCRCTYFGAELIFAAANVSLMLENPFPVPSLCKLYHISVCFIQISTKITCKQVIPLRESHIFWRTPQSFGLLGKFQHNINISIKMALVPRLSSRFLWLSWSKVYEVMFFDM